MGLIVTGMHRSGTSMVAGVLDQLGVSHGEGTMLGSSIVNPSGFFERVDVIAVNDSALQTLGGDWLVPPIFHSDTWLAFSENTVRNYRSHVKFIDGQSQNWFIKDPRISLLLPLWDRIALERLPTIIVVRNPLEIAQSLHLRNGLTHRQGLAVWYFYMQTLFSELRGRPHKIVDYQSALSDKVPTINSLAEFAWTFASLNLENVPADLVNKTAEFMNPEFSRSDDVSGIRGIGIQETTELLDIYAALKSAHLNTCNEGLFSATPDWISEALYESRKYRKLQDDLSTAQRSLVDMRRVITELQQQTPNT
ncbi:MAG: hypothetical protein WCO08_02120 [Actinomycetes bacterium]